VQLVEEEGVLVVNGLEDVTMPDVLLVVVEVECGFTVQLAALVLVVDGQPGSVNDGVV
jgi:hypothetical protein